MQNNPNAFSATMQQLMRPPMSRPACISGALMASFLFLSPLTAAAEEFDVAGIALGMSVEDVREAILDYNKEMKIRTEVLQMTYSDGVRKYRTEPFVRQVIGQMPAHDIVATIATPPEKPEVGAIFRVHHMKNEPVARGVYVDALIEKYGEPAINFISDVDFMFLYWFLGKGKVNCMPVVNQKITLDTSLNSSMLKIIQNPDGTMKNPEAKSPEDCAVVLKYQLNNDPVVRAAAEMVDVAAAARNEVSLRAWVDDLNRKAREDLVKQSGAAKPKI